MEYHIYLYRVSYISIFHSSVFVCDVTLQMRFKFYVLASILPRYQKNCVTRTQYLSLICDDSL
jgi:hypothetical protein